MNGQATAQRYYKKLLNLYPREFRERLGESMQQTFLDLYNEQRQAPARGIVVLSIFTETAIGIVQERLIALREEDVMKTCSPIQGQPRSPVLAFPCH
jgi:hypothetical protein